MVANQILGSRGFVVDVPGLDISASLESTARDLDRRGHMERCLSVAPPRARERRIPVEPFSDGVHSSTPRRGMNIKRGARSTRNSVRS